MKEHSACWNSLGGGADLEPNWPGPDLGDWALSFQDFVATREAQAKPTGSLWQQCCGCVALLSVCPWESQLELQEQLMTVQGVEKVSPQGVWWIFNLSCRVTEGEL